MRDLLDELRQLLDDKEAISETASFYLHEIERLKAEIKRRDELEQHDG